MCSRSNSVPRSISAGSMTTVKSPRRKSEFPGSLTDLHRYRKTVHGHDGDSRIVMVRKTDERTFASIESGKEPHVETITRETVETFRGLRPELKVTTEKKTNDRVPPNLLEALSDHYKTSPRSKAYRYKRSQPMDFETEFLKAHNEYRAKHGVPPLKINREMCRFSQQYAQTLLRKNTLQHSGHAKYGENLYYRYSSSSEAISGKEAVKNWYDEISKYNFDAGVRVPGTGHFTQVVWKDSKELGVGIAKANGHVYVVGNYYPAGNVIGSFKENVLPPKELEKETNNNGFVEKSFRRLDISENKKKSFPFSFGGRKIEGTEGNFEEDFLKAHNEYRARHGVSALKLDRKICKYAEEWAKMLASRNTLEHRKNCPYGENIFSMYSSDSNFKITGREPVDAWYDEIKYHPFGKEPNNLKSGHFTQVIWKTSQFLGVGVAKSRHGSIYVVANYSPAGNFVGSFSDNVPPLVSPSDGSEGTSFSQFVEKKSWNGGTGNYTQFQLDALKAHNEYRKKHGVPELALSKKLCDFAEEWAEHCLKHDLGLRPNNPYGENLLVVTSSDSKRIPDAKDVVETWYSEISSHDFTKESINYDTLHFSQIIWKDTKELGIAIVQNERGKAIIVANYNPRGNTYGQFKTNVLKPKV